MKSNFDDILHKAIVKLEKAKSLKVNMMLKGCNFTCPEAINAGGRPFSVWTRLHRLGGFWADTMLRLECWDEEKAAGCCDNIRSLANQLKDKCSWFLVELSSDTRGIFYVGHCNVCNIVPSSTYVQFQTNRDNKCSTILRSSHITYPT